MQIDLPKDVIAVATDLELERAKAVIAVRIVILGEDIVALNALHNDGLGRR